MNRRRSRTALLATACAVVSALLAGPTALPPASASVAAPAVVNGSVVLSGRGYGHGRGLGQWGSLGYAVDHGWSSAQILDRYYGGTSAGSLASGSQITVRLLANDNLPLMAQVSDTGLVTIGPDGVARQAVGKAVRIDTIGVDKYRVSDAPTCAGPWTARREVSGAQVRVRAGQAGDVHVRFGAAGDRPLAGDWDGVGHESIGIRRGATFYLRNSNTSGPADVAVTFGTSTDVPVVGDWDGDGDDTIGIRRGSTFYLRNSNTPGPPDITVRLGRSDDTPLVGNWDGIGGDGIGVRRGSTFHLSNGIDGVAERSVTYGVASDVPVVGDWDGDGDDTVGVRRSTSWYLRNQNTGGGADLAYSYGAAGKLPVVGRWFNSATLVGVFAAGTFSLATSHNPQSGSLLGDNESLGKTLQLCRGSSRTWYRGELRAANADGAARTVNAVSVEQYLRGVVPRESPASWGDAGGGKGMEALEAQSVAARSYAMAQNRYPYAKTCDTTSCQVYGGAATLSGGSVVSLEHPNTDSAIAATANTVRRRDGAVASTEFSSSTGGITAGGAFPSVFDHGDDTASNPYHFWTVAISHASLESRYGKSGFQSMQVIDRTTADGGQRVAKVRMTFSGGVTVDRTGAEFRTDWGLRSNWFDVGAPRGGDTVGTRDTATATFRLNDLPVSGSPYTAFAYGTATDVPVVGDWNGNGIDTVGVYRDGTWHLRNSNTVGGADLSFTFGISTDVPVTGDWDGNGTSTVGVQRGNHFLLSNTNSGAASQYDIIYGLDTDIPVTGDWDGNGTSTIGVYRSGTFHLRNSLSGGPAHLSVATGLSGTPVVGDWDGDGTDNVGLLSGSRFTLFVVNATGSRTFTVDFAAGHPLAGRWR